MLRKLLQPFYTTWVIGTFLCSLLIAFPFFLIIGVRDKPWARRAIWNICHYWAKGWLFIIGMPLTTSGHRPKDDKYVYVGNHISYMDTVDIYAAIPHYFRTLAKKEMAKIPIFGFVYKQLTILVDRSSDRSRTRSMRLMWRLLKNECNICVFPEGTFNETEEPLKEFYNGAFKLAINTQQPILPFVLLDTVNRWHYSAWWKLSPGRNRVVFLEPVSVEGMTLSDLNTLKNKVHTLMAEALQQHQNKAKG